MKAYAINLDSQTKRWDHMVNEFSRTSIELIRIPAVDGKLISLPDKNFSDKDFRIFHGREINIFEIACYWSHIKALQAFLETEDDYALICEDDIVLGPELEAILKHVHRYSGDWNILRLSGLAEGKPFKMRPLDGKHFLCLHIQRLKGAGAYIVDRKTAKVFVDKLMPMWLPYDHAFDREWFFGLKAFSVIPFPVSQTDKIFKSAIQFNSKPKLSSVRRSMTTLPFQAWNESMRWLFRGLHFVRFSMRSKTD